MVIALQTSESSTILLNLEVTAWKWNIEGGMEGGAPERVSHRWFEANIASFMLKWANISLENREWNRLFVIWLGVSSPYKNRIDGS